MSNFRLHWQFCLLLAAFLSLGITQTTQACAWDYDTIAMERQRFPEAHELIVGYFVRHSDAYYQWRIQDRQKTPLEQRTPAHYDDIAVAYDKLGESPKAIQTILEKIDRFPDQGVYESQANLGTFYIHNGELEKGLVHIKKAIEINPDAHFGREIYQQLLVEYVLECRSKENGDKLPMDVSTATMMPGFAYFLMERTKDDSGSFDNDIYNNAAKGILGMMRFGHYDSPILLEALGDILLARYGSGNMIAARAYLKAAMHVASEDAKATYRKKAERALFMQEVISTDRVANDLENEIKQGDALYAQIKADEQAWVQAGKNLDDAFKAKYYDQTLPVLEVNWHWYDSVSLNERMATVLFCFICIALPLIIKYRRKRKAQAKAQAASNATPAS